MDPSYSRTAILMNQDPNGEICMVSSSLIYFKTGFYSLINKIIDADRIIISSPCQLLVFQLLIFRRKIILDAGWPLSDSNLDSSKRTFRKIKNLVIDYFSFQLSPVILTESTQQSEYISSKFGVKSTKLKVSFTGVLEKRFSEIKKIERRKKPKIVLFRGKNNDEAGISKILILAKYLDQDIKVLIVSNRICRNWEIPSNVDIVEEFISDQKIREIYAEASISIGQLGNSERLSRTIPHKFFESFYFGVPYLTPNYPSLMQFMKEGELPKLILYSTEPKYIADSINRLLRNEKILRTIELDMRKQYQKHMSNQNIFTHYSLKILEN